MFWPFNRPKGWRKVKGREGFTVDMPCRPTHKMQQIELDNGSLNMSFIGSPDRLDPDGKRFRESFVFTRGI